jgi:hypothetical protein
VEYQFVVEDGESMSSSTSSSVSSEEERELGEDTGGGVEEVGDVGGSGSEGESGEHLANPALSNVEGPDKVEKEIPSPSSIP